MNPAEALRDLEHSQAVFCAHRSYRFADGQADLSSEDASFMDRLGEIFGECEVNGEAEARFRLPCKIRLPNTAPVVVVSFRDREPPDPVKFNLSLFPDRRYAEIPGTCADWRMLASPGETRPFAAFRDDVVVIDRNREWQAFVGHYVLHRVLRVQPDILFFHAGSVTVRGAGIFLMGDEGAGKTTLSMTLASRGALFLGDDIAALRFSKGPLPSYSLIPMRRAVSVRTGPRAALVDARIASSPHTEHIYPGGEVRIRAFASDLFSCHPVAESPLRAIFFLKGFSDRPRIERIPPGSAPVQWLTPMGSSLWGVSPAVRMMDFARLLRRVSVFCLHSGGSPEETAELVEQTVMEGNYGTEHS